MLVWKQYRPTQKVWFLISFTIIIRLTVGFDYNWSQVKKIIMVKEIPNQLFYMLHVATHILHVALYSYSMSFSLLPYSIYMIPPFYHHQLLSIITSSLYCKYRVNIFQSRHIDWWLRCELQKKVFTKKKKSKFNNFLLIHSAVVAQGGRFSQCEQVSTTTE